MKSNKNHLNKPAVEIKEELYEQGIFKAFMAPEKKLNATEELIFKSQFIYIITIIHTYGDAYIHFT